jgi:hypothetical protein
VTQAAHPVSTSLGRRLLHPQTLRLLAVAAAGALALLATTGVVQQVAFDQPSTLKYTLTIVAPLAAVLLLTSSEPLWRLTAAVVVFAPFSFVAHVGQLSLSPFAILLAAACLLLYAQAPATQGRRRSRLGVTSVIALGLLLFPLMHSKSWSTTATVVLAAAGVAWLVANLGTTNEARRRLVSYFVFAAAIQGVLAIYEGTTGHRLNLYGNGASTFGADYFFGYEDRYRPAAALSDPNSLGNVLALALPLAFVSVLNARDKVERVTFGVAGLAITLGLVLTLSRMSWIAAAAGIAIALLSLPIRKAMLGAAVVTAGIVIMLSTVTFFGGDSVNDRFRSIADPTSNTNSTSQGDLTRVQIWHRSWQVAREHLITGVGFDNLPEQLIGHVPDAQEASHAHSTYLNILAEGGLVATAAMGLVLVGAVRDWWTGLRHERVIFAGLGGSLGAMLVFWATDYTVRYISVTAMLAVVFGLLASSAATRKRPHRMASLPVDAR